VTIQTYPSVLPKPLIAGYQYETPDAVQRTENAEAYVGMRRRFAQRATTHRVRLLMTQAEFRIFCGFWIHGAKRGAAKFTMTLLTGSGLSTRIVRFIGSYQAQVKVPNSLWEVAAELEVEAEGVVAYESPVAVAPGSLSIALSAASSSQSGSTLGGNLSTPTITSSVTGGYAPYTYAWTKISGSTFGLANGSLASTQVFQSTATGDSATYTAVYRLTVTDLYGSTAYDELTVTHEYVQPFALLLEDASYLLLESGDRIVLE